MEIHLQRTNELKRTKGELEKKLNVKIKITGKMAEIEGKPLDEYEASHIIEAVGFGFSAREALKLKEENMLFTKINIKDFTRRKNLEDVRSRIIGTEGKTKKTLEQISGCDMVLSNNIVGIIGPAEAIENATTAIKNIVRGSKQSNVYRYLEKMNRAKRELK